MRQPRKRQSLSSAISAIETWSRPCTSDWKASWRSGIHFTVRFSAREAHTTIGYSGWTKIFMPKPPPTSPVRTRSLGEPIFRIMSATTGRIMLTPCEDTHRVERSSLASYSQMAPRGSIEFTTRRLLTICSFTTLSALAKAASVAAAVAHLPVEHDVVLDVVVHQRRAGLGRFVGADGVRPGRVVDLDQLGGVLGLLQRLGHDQRHRIADMADAAEQYATNE